MRETFDRLQTYHHHDCGAVRVCNDATRTVEGIFCIALWNHERYVTVHTERTGIVDHHSTKLRDVFSKLLGNTSSSRGERNVYSFEIVAVLQQLNLIVLSAESVLLSCRTL